MRQLVGIVLLFASLSVSVQQADSIVARMALQRYTFHQEKMHVVNDGKRPDS